MEQKGWLVTAGLHQWMLQHSLQGQQMRDATLSMPQCQGWLSSAERKRAACETGLYLYYIPYVHLVCLITFKTTEKSEHHIHFKAEQTKFVLTYHQSCHVIRGHIVCKRQLFYLELQPLKNSKQ